MSLYNVGDQFIPSDEFLANKKYEPEPWCYATKETIFTVIKIEENAIEDIYTLELLVNGTFYNAITIAYAIQKYLISIQKNISKATCTCQSWQLLSGCSCGFIPKRYSDTYNYFHMPKDEIEAMKETVVIKDDVCKECHTSPCDCIPF